MNYEQALSYIHSVSWRGSRLGLSRTRELLERLGNPEAGLPFVHIAGTNGKGSTAAMLSSILTHAGYRTGLYTSPFISRFNERMQIDGQCIPDETLAALTDAIRPVADAMEDHPTEFELITALALRYFADENCRIVVLEAGMGGALDSTNAIPLPEVAVITAMGMDHVRELGPTMADIARAKAGIIKAGGDVVSYGGNAEADAVIARACAERHARLVQPDFSAIRAGASGLHGQDFSYLDWEGLHLSLLGRYQLQNAALVLTVVETLRKRGWRIDDEAVRQGLSAARWPARFELLREHPVFLLDGGHNPHGIRATAESLSELFPGRRVTLLMGVMADKELSGMLDSIAPLAERCFTVRPDNPRAMDAASLALRVAERGVPAMACSSVSEGVGRAIEAAGPEGIVCALGSLYLCGAVRACVLA